jgi:hypothetical protein
MRGDRLEHAENGTPDVDAAGWGRLVAAVLGSDTGDSSGLFDILSRPVGAEDAWSPQHLDALWASAHMHGPVV